jgi:hypothetical protein
MDILKNAKKHFSERRELKGPIEVPEWGDADTPAEIYYQIPSMKERSDILALSDDKGLESLVMALIIMARDAQGEPMFAKAQKAELMRSVDPDVIMRVVGEMRTTDIPDELGN